jgi:hypothetical protein
MSININPNTNAVSWESLLNAIGDATKTEGTQGVADTRSVTFTTTVDGVETPVTVKIPDDLELPATVDSAAIDSLCEKLAADTGLNLSDEDIKAFRDALTATLAETLAAMPKDYAAVKKRIASDVAAALADAGHAGVAAVPAFIAGGDLLEHLGHHIFLGDIAQGLPAGCQISLLAKGDHLLGHRLNLLGPGEGGLNTALLQQIGGELTEHSLTLSGVSAQLTGSEHSYSLPYKRIT